MIVTALATVILFFAPNIPKAIQHQELALNDAGLANAKCRLYGGNSHMVCFANVNSLFLKIVYTPVTCDTLVVKYSIPGLLGTRKSRIPWQHNIFTCKTKGR